MDLSSLSNFAHLEHRRRKNPSNCLPSSDTVLWSDSCYPKLRPDVSHARQCRQKVVLFWCSWLKVEALIVAPYRVFLFHPNTSCIALVRHTTLRQLDV